MKMKSIMGFAAAACLLAACNNQGSTGNNTAEATQKADSLVYCFGQLRGTEYNKEAERDTTLAESAARQEYIRGVKAGLAAIKAGKDTYNKGVFLGMQMAMNIAQFDEEYGIRLSDKLFVEGLTEAITSDSTLNASELQSTFYKLMNELNQQKEERDKAAAAESLKKAAESQKMASVADGLYGNVEASSEPKIKDGDKVSVDIRIYNLSGKEIDAPFPKVFTVGERMGKSPLTAAVCALASGQTGTFLTTAHDLFGGRAPQLGLKTDEVLKLVVTPTLEAPEEE